MRLEKDPARIRQLARERDEENWRFRSFLKQSDMDIEEMDAIVHRIHEEVAGRIDCTECGNCCRRVLPFLSKTDTERLASGLGISVGELADRHFEYNEEEEAFTFNRRPCPFLADDRCSVYEFRPDECRSYPHLHKDEFVFRLMGVVFNYEICPIVFNVYERLKEELWHAPDDLMDEDWSEDGGAWDVVVGD